MKRVLKWTLGIVGAVVVLFVGTGVLVGVWQGLTAGLQAPPAVAESTATAASVAQRAPNTAEPTFTIQPTYTPQATYTALPTYTPQPTYTPLPTDTPPRPTNTPRATNTPRPTNTPQPTSTVAPTSTPTPRPLPTATTAPLPTNPPAPAALPAGGETAVVTKIIDGDTIEVSMNGSAYRVRYIGMDTPEIGSPCAREATTANAQLVSGRTVRLVKDVSETDRYDRLLRYVYIGDTFVNGALVAGGWAIAKDYPPDTAMSGVLHSLEAQGASQGCALVSAAVPTVPARAPAPIPIAPPPPAATQPPPPPAPEPTQAPPAGNCDPAYPTVCIPSPPPDLDCKDIPYRRFTVLSPDPHRFDGDGNGIGCESG